MPIFSKGRLWGLNIIVEIDLGTLLRSDSRGFTNLYCDWYLSPISHSVQSVSRNQENSSSMLQSRPKYFISNELNKSFTVVIRQSLKYVIHCTAFTLYNDYLFMKVGKREYRGSPHFVISKFVIPSISWFCFWHKFVISPPFRDFDQKKAKKKFFLKNFRIFFFFFRFFFLFKIHKCIMNQNYKLLRILSKS